MARANLNTKKSDFFESLTDCESFLNGHCRFGRTCRYRHCFEAKTQLSICSDWPDVCCRIQCRFRHPAILPEPKATILNSATSILPKDSAIGFFWDIENVPIPRGQRPFDIVQHIRQKLVLERGLQEIEFSCYCNIDKISKENQQSLQHATVTIVHVPDRKSNAVDRQILLHLDRFERVHRPPATIVLISGDIDFVGKLSDLRYRAGFHVIVIHNRPAKQELKVTVNEHYSWELFTREPDSNNNRSMYDNRLSRPKPAARSNRIQSRTSMSDSRNNDNSVVRNSPMPSASPPYSMQYRQVDPASLSNSDSNQSTFPVYYLNPNDIAPTYPFPMGALPMAPSYPSTVYNNIETDNIPSCSMQRRDNRSNRKKRRERNTPQECAFCEDEFDTIQALRQHQKDKCHVYGCPICNQGFFTYEGQLQHQIAKGHDLSRDDATSDNKPIIANRNGTQEPVSGGVIIRGLMEMMQEILK